MFYPGYVLVEMDMDDNVGNVKGHAASYRFRDRRLPAFDRRGQPDYYYRVADSKKAQA
jgi:hypothetical protein